MDKPLDVTAIPCPLCGHTMIRQNDHLVCAGNPNHVLSVSKEVTRFADGEKNMQWLASRMKVHMGKLVHKK